MRKHKGFTLIELVVVVMILGILAAVAAPKLLTTSGVAADNGLKETLGVVRDAIERFAADHAGELPGKDGNEATLRSDLAPKYIRVFPKCPVGVQNNGVKIIPGPAGPITGDANPAKSWAYNTADGGFICNWGADVPSSDDPAVTYDTL
jgi:prepilin-type N-terminal cleavage/methylation domain-containing protein